MSVFAEFFAPVTALRVGAYVGGRPGLSVEYEQVVPTDSSTHYLWATGDDHEQLVRGLRNDPAADSVSILDEIDDRVLVRVRWTDLDSPLLRIIEESDGTLVDVRGRADGWTIHLRFPDQDAVVSFYEASRELGVVPRRLQLSNGGFTRADDGFGLSDVQRETIATAFEAGYFDVPRSSTMTELADELGVSDQAVSERLRRGLGQFLTATIREAPDDAAGPDDDP